ARKISSNHVCRLYDLVELPHEMRGVTMELIEGQTLGQFILDGVPVDYLRFAKWGGDVASGLSAAHALSIIHRDLKPDNIMVTSEDRAVVLDFGVARHSENVGQDQRLTREGTILGTVPYMAPEQLSNAPLDPRSDLYALGLILAELSTGEIPAYGSSYHETLTRRVIDPEVYSLQERDPGSPDEFAAVVDHLLRTAIEERPFSAKMVADHLRRYSGTEGLSIESDLPRRPSSMPRPMTPPNSHTPEPLVSLNASIPVPAAPAKPVNLMLLFGVALLCVGLAIAVAVMTKKPEPTAKGHETPKAKVTVPATAKTNHISKPPPVPVEKTLKKAPPTAKKAKPKKVIKKRRPTNAIPPAEEL
ncbi:MAG: serine/threonine-protein kinase, partial [Rhodospirillales bacterium]|nr:serine/threonine-protein kinase [Rhodospirillales bacterium]